MPVLVAKMSNCRDDVVTLLNHQVPPDIEVTAT